MICHHYKCIFIHIPKNAGQSIEHVFLDLLNLTWDTRAPLLLRNNDRSELGPPRLAHLNTEEYVRYKYVTQEMFDEYFKFAFVRNPWSRMVSFYKYLGFSKKCDFRTFLLGVFKDNIYRKMRWFVGPQSNFVCSDDGELLVDFIGRFEELQDGFDHVCNKIGIPLTKLPHINETKENNHALSLALSEFIKTVFYSIKKNGIISYKQYQDYYDQESIDFVAEIYKKDIELFNYDFV